MLNLIQQFYLLGAGDFYLEFISRTENAFLNNRDEISDGWFQASFNNCVNCTSLASSFDYISQHIRLNKLRLLSPFDIWKSPFFTIEKEPNLEVIFTSAHMHKYEQLFSMLMNLRTQTLVLERIWIDHCYLSKELFKVAGEVRNEIKMILDQFNLLRLKIHNFLNTLQNFYYLHIIDKSYRSLLQRLHAANEFDMILKLHSEFVDDLCRYLFIRSSEVGIKQNITDLVDISKKFVGIQNKLFDSIHDLLDKVNVEFMKW